MSTRWSEYDYNAWLAKNNPRAAVQITNVESTPGNGSLAKKAGQDMASFFRVRCHTRGKRLGDVDGRSCKAVFDGLTKAGVWPDDSAKFVKEVCFTQELGEEDETIIEIEEIG